MTSPTSLPENIAEGQFGAISWANTVSIAVNYLTKGHARYLGLAPYLAAATFTGTDGAELGTTDSGQAWTEQQGNASILGNKATSLEQSVVTFDAGTANVDAECWITPVAGTAPGLIVRGGATTADRLAISLDMTNGFRLNRTLASSTVAVQTEPYTFTAGTAYHVRAVCLDTIVACYLDGVLRICYVLSTSDMTTLGSLTRVGLRMNTTASPGPTWDHLLVKQAKDDTIGALPANVQTGTAYTTVFADKYRAVVMTNAAANAVTIPPHSTVPYPLGTILNFREDGAGQTTMTPGTGVTFNGASGFKTRAQYSALSMVQDKVIDTWNVFGDTAV